MLRVMVRALALVAALALAGCGERPSRPGPPAPPPAGTVVWAVGDAATGGDDPRPLAELVRRGPVDRLVYLGDVYEDGTREEFDRRYDPLYGALAERTLPVIGNHEYEHRERGFEPYWREKTGRTPPPWHAVEVAGWELLILNSEAPHGKRSRQVRWLRDRLAAGERTTCRIAFWHRPRFSAGRQGDQRDVAPLWDAVRGHAIAVVSGHDHDLQRLHPIDGMVQFVSGAGGRGLYDVDEDDERLAFGNDDRFGGLRLELRPAVATYTFVDDAGRMLDRGELRCR
jgi:predicted phosphodiesterase